MAASLSSAQPHPLGPMPAAPGDGPLRPSSSSDFANAPRSQQGVGGGKTDRVIPL